MTTSDDTASIDLATVIAISVLAYTLGNVVDVVLVVFVFVLGPGIGSLTP